MLNKEREALLQQLDYWETEDVEKKYIFEALGLLSTRENLVINEDSVSLYIYNIKIVYKINYNIIFFLKKEFTNEKYRL